MKKPSFYIAKRYLFAQKGSTAVTFITWLAVGAMSIAVMAMFIIISVFSGLEDLNEEIIADLHADLTIKSKSGKRLNHIDKIQKTLKNNPEILHYSRVIEEKAYINYGDKGDIAFVRGVDSAYVFVNPIDEKIVFGSYPSFEYSNEVAMESQLNMRLSLGVQDGADFATLLMPKAGKGLIKKESDIFNKRNIITTGIFTDGGDLKNYIIAPIELTEDLLNLPKNSAYQIVIKLRNPSLANEVKTKLLSSFHQDYIITTKAEENATFWKMIKMEKLFIYLVFVLLIFITCFNLAGAIVILKLDKKEQNKSLVSLGVSMQGLRKIYFNTGVLIVAIGVISGLLIGSLICYFQIQTGYFKGGENWVFPVKITLFNYITVATISLVLGISVAWFSSKIDKNHIMNY